MGYLIAFNYPLYTDTKSPGPRGISIYDPVEGNAKKLFEVVPSNGSLGKPAWADEGSTLLFSSFFYGASSQGGCGIYALDLKTKKISYLWGHKTFTVFDLRLSPDGEYLACEGTMHSRNGVIVFKRSKTELTQIDLFSAKEVGYFYNPLWKDERHLFVCGSSENKSIKRGYSLCNVETKQIVDNESSGAYTLSPQKGLKIEYIKDNTPKYNSPNFINVAEEKMLEIKGMIPHPGYEPSEAPRMAIIGLPTISPDDQYIVYTREYTLDGDDYSKMYIYDIKNSVEKLVNFSCVLHAIWCPFDDVKFDFETIELNKVGRLSLLQSLFS